MTDILANKHFSDIYLTHTNLADRHLADRHWADRHFAEKHLVDRHLANKHLADVHLANTHLAERHLADTTMTFRRQLIALFIQHVRRPNVSWSNGFRRKDLDPTPLTTILHTRQFH